MQLTVRDVAQLLKVTERTIYRWLKQGTIPNYKILDQYRFSMSEVLEWSAHRKGSAAPEIIHEPSVIYTEPLPNLLESVKQGGIYYRIGGSNKEDVLRNIVDILPLPKEIDREFLLRILLARESLSSTGVGDGIAFPHVRNPIVLNEPCSMTSLCFLENPVDFGALDGKPVHCIFATFCLTVRNHLHLLSKISFALKDRKFKEVILKHSSREEILNELKRVELCLINNQDYTNVEKEEIQTK